MYGIMLVAVLIITGGVIAFIGDRLGTKVGKKKLSLFGLRPRHTSVVVTIITGIMITTITFTILSVASENVRLALFGMDKLKQQMVQTQNELDEKSTNLLQTKKDLGKIKSEYDNSKKELEASQKDLEASKAKSRALMAEQANLIALNGDLSAKNRDLYASNNALKATNSKLDSENAKLEETNQNLRQGIETIREHPIVYRVGELLASGTIAQTEDVEEAEKEIGGLISLANSKIISNLGNDTHSAVRVYPNEYHHAIQQIITNSDGTVVRLVVAANMVNGDPVITNIETYPNRLVYAANTLIYQNYYDLNGTMTTDAMIGDFLRGVNKAAVKNGLLPNPLTGTVGALSGSQIMELEDILNKTSGRILIQAYAENNTSINDPLRLDIVIKQ